MACRISASPGVGLASSNALADSTIPGVQKPHWVPPSSTSALWIGCSSPALASPSMVSTSRPATSSAKTRQALTGAPSIRTVQVPQLPLPHPSLVPVKPMRSRKSSSSVSRGSTNTECSAPLMVELSSNFMSEGEEEGRPGAKGVPGRSRQADPPSTRSLQTPKSPGRSQEAPAAAEKSDKKAPKGQKKTPDGGS